MSICHSISRILFYITFQDIAGKMLSAAAEVLASNQVCVQAQWSKAEEDFWKAQKGTLEADIFSTINSQHPNVATETQYHQETFFQDS